ncbi:MAG: hypothetical protein WEB60_08725 [Terrimicrobiaceae bacterium]
MKKTLTLLPKIKENSMKPLLMITMTMGWLGTTFATPLIREQAVPYVRPSTVPEASAVSMRTLRFRPVSYASLVQEAEPPQDTFKAMKDFHATRLEWSYLESFEPGTSVGDDVRLPELENVKQVKKSGRIFGGASNASSGTYVRWDNENGQHVKRYTIVDRSGNPVILGHMRLWKNPQSPGCMNNPEYRKGHLNYLKKYVDAGATTIQRDEPGTQSSFAAAGSGCFCNYCMDGFREYLNKNVSESKLQEMGVKDIKAFNYRDHLNAISAPPATEGFDWSDPQTVKKIGGALHEYFQKFQTDSTVEFFKWIREQLAAYNGGVPVGYTCNNTSFQDWESPMISIFDFSISEMMMKTANPGHIYERAQKALSLGSMQVFGTPKTMGMDIPEHELVRLKQQVIATAYASGALAAVPWDVFLQSKDGNARYFCKPEDFSPIFGFVRANDRYLTGYCTAGGKGPDFEDNRYATDFPIELTNTNICVVLRAVPKDENAPVVVHLVDWTKGKQGQIPLKLKTDAFFPGKTLSVKLRTPKAYDPAANAAAEAAAQAMRKNGGMLGAAQASAYESLVEEVDLEAVSDGEWTTITVPALSPWGILVVAPGNLTQTMQPTAATVALAENKHKIDPRLSNLKH